MTLLVIGFLILFFFWPVILVGGIIFLVWIFWPEKKWQCPGCDKKFHKEKSCKEHTQNCEQNRRQKTENKHQEEQKRQRKQYRHRWGKNRDSSFYDNPFDDDFWKEDVYGNDQREKWEEDEEYWKDKDPEWFYNTRGDYYQSQKNFREEQEYWKRQYEEAKREYDRAYEELMKELDKPDVKKCYKILGLATTATFDDVKKQFRKLVLKYHPDKCKDKRKGERKFKEIFEAYETIKNSVTSNA